MKKSKALLIVMSILLLGSLLLTCKKQDNEPAATDNEVAFSIDVINTKSDNSGKGATAYNLADAVKIILTIQNNDGSATKYTSTEVKILQMNGSYYTQKLVLKTGTYKLMDFVLIDATGNTIYASPLAGSQEAQNVTNPLPITFTVAKNATSPVNVQVLSTAAHTPEDFGLSHFPVTEINTLSFMIGVIDNSSDDILPAKLTVSNGAYSYVQNLSSVLNNVVTVIDGLPDYTLTLEYTGFVIYTHTYTIDSLKIFEDAVGNLPLLVELEKVNDLTVTDIDGNVYNTVTIGTQVWMAENLNTTKYNDGTAIPNITVNATWAALTTGAYSDYENNAVNSTTYGRLYNWYVVDNNASTKVASNGGKNVCPTGWHVPTVAEFTTLSTYLGGDAVAGGKLKETGTTHWSSPNTGATNVTGFTALPGGRRDLDGSFYYIFNGGFWWATTAIDDTYARALLLDAWLNELALLTPYLKNGYSVRCLKD